MSRRRANAADFPKAAAGPGDFAKAAAGPGALAETAAGAGPLAEAAPVFAALGDETRLRIVSRLCVHGPLSISRLSEGSGVTRQAVTKHLHALAGAGLVHDTRRGRERIWALEPENLELARRSLDRIAAQWDAAIGRLRALVEDEH